MSKIFKKTASILLAAVLMMLPLLSDITSAYAADIEGISEVSENALDQDDEEYIDFVLDDRSSASAPNWNNSGYSTLNPFAQSGWYGQFTWYAWGRAYEKTGIQLPYRGNAQTWDDGKMDKTPRANSIAVWTGGNTGHVAYVDEVNGNNIVLSEANYGYGLMSQVWSLNEGKKYYNGIKTYTLGDLEYHCYYGNQLMTFKGFIHVDSSGNNPIGSLDSVTVDNGKINVKGWAYDPDNAGKSIAIDVYFDEIKDSNYLGGGIANKSRPDVNTNPAYKGIGVYHGFEFSLSSDKLADGKHKIFVYAINIDGTSGISKLLNESGNEVSIRYPIGDVNSIIGGNGSVNVKGWAFDPDNSAKALEIHVFADGAAQNNPEFPIKSGST